MARDVVVTGLGCVSGLGVGAERNQAALMGGRRSPSRPTVFTADCKEYGLVFEAPEPAAGFGPGVTRTNAFAFMAAEEALRDAGLGGSVPAPGRAGVCLGTTVGCSLNDEVFYRFFHKNQVPSVDSFVRYLSNNPAQALARRVGALGPAVAVGNACSSGTDAIGLARQWILSGRCDVALAGGCDELCRTPYLGFTSLLNSSPEPCRPFDAHRKGLNLGEGAGVLVLESLEHARARGASVKALISGFASHVDAHHATAPHPGGRGLERALHESLAEAGLSPADIAFVNTHGTATPTNDLVEGATMARVFGPGVVMVSTKGATGHALGAAGGLEAIYTILALRDGKVSQTLGFETPDPAIGVSPTTAVTPIRGGAAVSSNLAFGGQNSVLVFRAA